jgi:ABC-type dipeptide/oligopeptide/nickel transport system permease subunit
MVGLIRGLDILDAEKCMERDLTDKTDFSANQMTSISVRRYSEFRRVINVFFGRKLSLIGFVIILFFILTAIFAPWIVPHDPFKIDLTKKLLKPNKEHILGTDSLGRDTLSRIIYASRTSLIVGTGSVGMAVIIGQSLGLIAGFFGGLIFAIIMRVTDALMASPMILNALVIATLLGGGLKNVIVALGIGMISGHCRLMCSQVLTIKQNEYVTAARAMGATNPRIMLGHIIPNSFPPLIVMITIGLGTAILAEAGLSFLGIGIEPPGAAWGSMVNDGYKYLLMRPMLSFAPGIAIMLTVFGFNMMGDGLRDALDPKLRGVI